MRLRAIQLTVIGIVLASSIAAGQSRAASQTFDGRWSLAIKTVEGAETRILDLAIANDSSVTGTVTSSLGAIAIAAGRVERDRVRFEFTMAGGEVRVAYDLVLRADTLRGVFRQDGYSGEVLGVRGDRQVRFPTGGGHASGLALHEVARLATVGCRTQRVRSVRRSRAPEGCVVFASPRS